jgi:hypothetical protein
MNFFGALCWLFYWLVHGVVGAIIWVCGVVVEVVSYVSYDVGGVKAAVASFKKVPSHLGLVMEGEVFQEDLARLICWAMCAGISDITVFDPKGTATGFSPTLSRHPP